MLVVLLLLASTACRRPPSDEAERSAEVTPESSPAPAAGGAGEPAMPPLPTPTDRAMLTVQGQSVRLGPDEARAVRAALVASIEASSVPYKAELLAQTKDAPIDFEADLVRIGLWILSAPDGSMQLMYREPSDAPASFFYRAKVENHAGRWEVLNLTRGELRRRR
jgi:hypothetical protein